MIPYQLVLPILLWAHVHFQVLGCGIHKQGATSLPESHLISIWYEATPKQEQCVEAIMEKAKQ